MKSSLQSWTFNFFLLCNRKMISLKINRVCFLQFTFRCCEASKAAELSQAPSSSAKAAAPLPVFNQRAFCCAPKWPNNTWYCCWTKQGGELHCYLICVHLKCSLSVNLDVSFSITGARSFSIMFFFYIFPSSLSYQRGKRVSQIRIRRGPPRETPLTPMGLPKVKRCVSVNEEEEKTKRLEQRPNETVKSNIFQVKKERVQPGGDLH